MTQTKTCYICIPSRVRKVRDIANSVSVLNSWVVRVLSFQVQISTCSVAISLYPTRLDLLFSEQPPRLSSERTNRFFSGSVVLLLCWTSPTAKSQAFHREPARTLPDSRLLPLLPQPFKQEGTSCESKGKHKKSRQINPMILCIVFIPITESFFQKGNSA